MNNQCTSKKLANQKPILLEDVEKKIAALENELEIEIQKESESHKEEDQKLLEEEVSAPPSLPSFIVQDSATSASSSAPPVSETGAEIVPSSAFSASLPYVVVAPSISSASDSSVTSSDHGMMVAETSLAQAALAAAQAAAADVAVVAPGPSSTQEQEEDKMMGEGEEDGQQGVPAEGEGIKSSSAGMDAIEEDSQ